MMQDLQTKLNKTVRDRNTCCDYEWDKLLGFWKRTDQIVLRIIAHAQGDPKDQVQLDGKTVKSRETKSRFLRSEEHSCKKTKGEEENANCWKEPSQDSPKRLPAGRKFQP